MARYDRIAPLVSPERDHAFAAWPVLRDIEGQDRDADVCRRARIRFLALRPVRRVAEPNASVSAASYSREIERVREEVGALAQRDVERVRTSRFLRQIEDREPRRLVAALLETAERIHAAGHVHGAREYAVTANMIEAGSADELLARFDAALDSDVDHGTLLESAWNTLRNTEDQDQRAVILEQIGRSLLALRMLTAADRCLAMVTIRQTDLSVRSRARAAHVLCAALQGDPDVMRDRRTALLNDDSEWAPDPRIAASVHSDLAESCVLAGDIDDAREHVRASVAIARRHDYAGVLARAEGILTALEQNTESLLQARPVSSEAAQRIAAQIESLGVPAPAH